MKGWLLPLMHTFIIKFFRAAASREKNEKLENRFLHHGK
jgi:hypothetical protein